MSKRHVLVGCGAVGAVLLALMVYSQQSWQQRAVALNRENTALQLRQMAKEIATESVQLTDLARDMTDAEPVLRMVQEPPGSVHMTDLGDLSGRPFDSMLILDTGFGPRLSAGRLQGQLGEEPPDPELLQFVRAAAANAQPASLALKTNRWMVARPVTARASGQILGWVGLARSLSPAVNAQVRGIVRGSVTESRDWREPGAIPGKSHEITTQLSSDAASGFVILRDITGQPVWVMRLKRSDALSSADTSATRNTVAGYIVGSVLALALLSMIVLAAFALRRYVNHQKSVDARYKALIDQSNDGIVIVDASTYQVIYTNPAFLELLGYSDEEVKALTLTDLFADGDSPAPSLLAKLSDASSRMAMHLQQRCKGGALIEVEVRCNALDVDGRDVLAYVTHDVSLRKKAELQIKENQLRLDRIAHHDQLTGLPNRHFLATFLPQAIEQAKADNSMLGVVFLDLDRFKHINDTRGHETGDKLLQEVATRLRSCVRDHDVIIRMGGDEFVVIFRAVKSHDEVTQGAARIVESLNSPIVIDRHALQTTGSVGVSLYPRDGENMVELLKHSDTAMYQAKERGRNNVQVFSQVMNRKLKQRVAIEASLREALRLKQLDVHFQPLVNLATRQVVGLEALMRWTHPVHGMVPADQFIPVAEESGLIVPMGNFVLHRTMQVMSAWRKMGIPLVPVSLNVAPAQLQRGDLPAGIATLLKSHGLRPNLIQLELTERAVFDSSAARGGDNRRDTMARLRDLGIKIAIDDFGTGYSSLSYLKHWRVDALKIDRSFVRDLVTDASDLAIVSAIIAIAKHMNIQVVAEGIESFQQAEILRRLGCSIGQGFLFSQPMAGDQTARFMLDNGRVEKVEEDDMLAAFSAGRG